ncbi:MAG: nitroreductase family protein [Proteobacteria bacterium]|nr:nitroreductase family protein [Pseudomonadota bacterium]
MSGLALAGEVMFLVGGAIFGAVVIARFRRRKVCTGPGLAGNIMIDSAVCTGCGLCASVCGSSAITVVDKRLTLSKPALCCSCGHCAAICPVGAISARDDINRRAFTVRRPDDGLGPVEVLLRTKRSVREFKDKALARDALERLVEYAEKSPSSSNNRHRKYVVVTDTQQINVMEDAVLKAYKTTLLLLNPVVVGAVKLVDVNLGNVLSTSREDLLAIREEAARGHKPIFRGAPCVICVAAPKDDIQAIDDCIIAQQYMMLYGETQGIGSCVIGYAQYAHRAIERIVDLPKGCRIYAVGIFGYSKYKYQNEIRYERVPEVIWS